MCDDILLPSCGFTSCHGSGAGGPQLDDATSHANLLDVTSIAMAGGVAVFPGDAEGSCLVTKLEDSGPIAGDPMHRLRVASTPTTSGSSAHGSTQGALDA